MSFKELPFEIAEDLHNAGIGVFGTSDPDARTIFVGEMPAETVEGILIVPVPSPPPHRYLDTEYLVLDFWSRAPHTDRSLALLRDVYERMHRRYQFSTGSWFVYFAAALGSIHDVDRDNEGGKMFRLSVQFICRNLSHVS